MQPHGSWHLACRTQRENLEDKNLNIHLSDVGLCETIKKGQMHILTWSLDTCMPGAFPEQEGPWQGTTSLFVLIRRRTLPLSYHSAQPGFQSAGWVFPPLDPPTQPGALL